MCVVNDSSAVSTVAASVDPATAASVAPSKGPVIALNTSAAFQLLVAAGSPEVREAAAEALWPREFADQCELECNTARFEDLCLADRVRALLVASVIDRNPRSAKKLGVEPLYHFDAPQYSRARGSIFRMQNGRVAREFVDPRGRRQRLTRNAAFTVPDSAYGTVMQCCNWGSVEFQPYRAEYRWQLDERGASLNISSRARSRSYASWSTPSVVSASGEHLTEVEGDLDEIFGTGRIALGSGLLLRLAAGALSGAVIAFDNQLPIVRGRRPRDATISIEIGPGVKSPLIGAHFKGDLSPRYEIDDIVGSSRVEVPILGGATIAELDVIARKVGVAHGCRIRGSFHHHPLRAGAKGAA
jgi:hypothetical protein